MASKTRSKKPAAPPTEKAAYLAERDAAIEALYLNEGYDEPREIAHLLWNRGLIDTKDESLESATRIVRGVLAGIRARLTQQRTADAQEGVSSARIDILLRQLRELKRQLARQELIASGEPTELCARSKMRAELCGDIVCAAACSHLLVVVDAVVVTTTDTPNGMMTIQKLKWPAGVRQRASHDAVIIARRIAEIESEVTAERDSHSDTGEAEGEDGGLTIIESNDSNDQLIARNLAGGKPAPVN
jgi:hypothetical protein